MNIVLFNVAYSPNLGDGVIAECLEAELARHFPGESIKTFDLAGRRSRSIKSDGGSRLTALKLFPLLPPLIRDALLELIIRIRVFWRTGALWDRALRSASVAIVGGGHLIQDGDPNFPSKLAILAAKCRRHNVPIALYAVGVSDVQSQRGAAMISALWRKNRLVFAGARDPKSADRLRRRGLSNVVVTPDPGLLAPKLWPLTNASRRPPPRVGIGITHPSVLRHHSTGIAFDTRHTLALYCALITKLTDAGYDVICFTNGAHEDELFLNSVLHSSHFRSNRENLERADRCSTPRQLAELIHELDAVVAFRLHACILAYAYSIPHVGLSWDPKLADFFSSVGRSDSLVQFDADSIERMPALIDRVRFTGIDEDVRQRALRNAGASVALLAQALRERTAKKILRDVESHLNQPAGVNA
jgi:polysaccharide pyruvyl transferase WcaK-like protein